MFRYQALLVAVLLLPQAGSAFADDGEFHYAPAISNSGPFENPQGDSLPTIDGDVLIYFDHTISVAPAAPGFAAPAFVVTSIEPPSGPYYSPTDYHAAYGALLRDIASDVARENGGAFLPFNGPLVSVPEPSSVVLLVMGAAGLFLAARRRRPA